MAVPIDANLIFMIRVVVVMRLVLFTQLLPLTKSSFQFTRHVFHLVDILYGRFEDVSFEFLRLDFQLFQDHVLEESQLLDTFQKNF